jgi:hypothetical protein
MHGMGCTLAVSQAPCAYWAKGWTLDHADPKERL